MDAKIFFETLNKYFDENQIKEAGELLEQTLDEAREAGDIPFELSILNEMMGYYRSTNQKEKGLTSVADGLRLIQENNLGENPVFATMWINMGTTLCHFEHVEEAETCYKNAEKIISGQPQEAITMASFYNNTAAIYVKRGDYKEADERYQFALKMLNKAEETPELWGDVLFNRLVTYLNILIMNQVKMQQINQNDETVMQKNQSEATAKQNQSEMVEQKNQCDETAAQYGNQTDIIKKDTDHRLEQIREILSNQRFRESPYFDFAIKKCEQCFEDLGLLTEIEWLKQYKRNE